MGVITNTSLRENMIKKIILISILFLSAVLISGVVSAADDNNNTVNTTSDLQLKAYTYNDYNYTQDGSVTCVCFDAINNGPSDATGVQVKLNIPEGMKVIDYNVKQGTYDPNTQIWTIGHISPAGVPYGIAYINIFLKATNSGTFTFHGNITGDQYDNNLTNNVNSTTIITPPFTDIQINQTVNNTSPIQNEQIKYTTTVTNNGPIEATSIKITNTIPTELEFVSATGNYTYNSAKKTITWTINTLANQTSIDLTLIAKVLATSGTQINNTVKCNRINPPVTGGTQYDQNKTNNAACTSIIVNRIADIQVNQTSSNYSPNYLDNITLTVTTKNNGPENATGVKTTIKLPFGLQYISYEAIKGTYDPVTGIWDIGNINNQESFVLTILAKVVEACSINNTANKSAEVQYDPVVSNNAQTVNLNVPEAADIQVTETTPTTVNFGDQVCVYVTTKNNGPDTANNVQVKISLPTGFFYSSHSGGNYNSTTGMWTVGSLLNGTSATLNIIGTILTTNSFTINSTKTTENEYDYNLTNDAVSKVVSLDMGNVVSFSSVDDGSSSKITLPFTVYLFDRSYNTFYINVNGLVSFTDTISDYIPDPNIDEAFIAPFWDDIYLTSGAAVYYKVDGDTVTITWVKVPSYLERNNPTKFNTFQLRILRNSSTGDTIYGFVYGDMQWKVGYKNGNTNGKSFAGFGGDLRNWLWYYHTYTTFWTSSGALSQITNQTFWFNHSGVQIAAPAFVDPDIDVTQVASAYNPARKETFNITVTVVNLGPEATSGIQILDQIPNGLKLISASPSKGTYDSSTGIWNIGNLEINETVTLTLNVNATKRGTYINHAEKISQVEYDPNSENDASDITITVS